MRSTTPAFGRGFLSEFPLDPDITYLNHGTVGVTPRAVMAAQQAIRDQIERQPATFILRDLAPLPHNTSTRSVPWLREAAGQVAEFLGARGDDVVFVDNATTGANAVLQSFPLLPGDEILVTDTGYGGVTHAARYAARRVGAIVTTAAMPMAGSPAEDFVAAVEGAVTSRTRLAIVDHIVAATALVLPLKQIAAALKAKGVAVLADGAHVPGSIPLHLDSLGVDYYVGNLHKWMWTPRSSAILWAAPHRQDGLQPVVASWGLDQGFTAAFDAPGTRDPSAHLTAPRALQFMRSLGIEAVQEYNHRLAVDAGRILAAAWNTQFSVPEAMVPTMVTVMLPEHAGRTMADAGMVRDRLLFDHQIEVMVTALHGRVWARVSAQIYNDLSDVERLANAVRQVVHQAG